MKKDQPLEFILELLVLAKKQKDWKKVEMTIQSLLKYGDVSSRNRKDMRKKLENIQITNHHLTNKLKGFDGE